MRVIVMPPPEGKLPSRQALSEIRELTPQEVMDFIIGKFKEAPTKSLEDLSAKVHAAMNTLLLKQHADGYEDKQVIDLPEEYIPENLVRVLKVADICLQQIKAGGS